MQAWHNADRRRRLIVMLLDALWLQKPVQRRFNLYVRLQPSAYIPQAAIGVVQFVAQAPL